MTLDLPIDDRRVRWLLWWQVAKARRYYRPDPIGHTGLEDRHPGRVPVAEGQAEIIAGLAPLCARMPRPRLAGVVLPPRRPLPSGAADRARLALGRDGSWPLPLWPEEDSDE